MDKSNLNNNEGNHDKFDIIDFELNEYNDVAETEEPTVQEIPKPQSKTYPDSDSDTINNPNRDMLKTIILILIVILIACMFLGLISFMVNHSGQSNPNKKNDIITSETSQDNDTIFNKNTAEATTKDTQKEQLEDHIDEITNNVNNDLATTEQPDSTATTPESTTEISTTETTEAATVEPTTETLPESTTETTTEAATEISTETTIDISPEVSNQTATNTDTQPEE